MCVHGLYQGTILEPDVDTAGEALPVRAGSVQEISVPSAQFCSAPKTALKYKIYFKKITMFSPYFQTWSLCNSSYSTR